MKFGQIGYGRYGRAIGARRVCLGMPIRNAPATLAEVLPLSALFGFEKMHATLLSAAAEKRLRKRNNVGLCFFEDARLKHIEQHVERTEQGSECFELECWRKEKMLDFDSCHNPSPEGETDHQPSIRVLVL